MHVTPASTVDRWPLWVVIVGGQSSDIYCRATYSSEPALVGHVEHPAAGLREQDRVADDAGRAFDSKGHARHRMEPRTTQKRHQKQDYARDIVEIIDRAHAKNAFGSLLIAAPPQLLGELRALISAPVEAAVVCELDKDLSAMDSSALQQTVNDAISRRRAE